MLLAETKPAPAIIERRQSRGRQAEVCIRAVNGFDHGRGLFAHRISEQLRQALRNGEESLALAGLCMRDVVRVTYMVHDPDAFPACFPLLRDAFDDARPAATLRVIGGFDRPGMQIELELVARATRADGPS